MGTSVIWGAIMQPTIALLLLSELIKLMECYG